MTLVDTSVWIDHFAAGNADLRDLLGKGEVITHPFIIGELACGSLKNRTEILALMGKLPSSLEAHHDEVMRLVEAERLFGTGIGWIDAHLIASAMLSKAKLFTLDKKLHSVVSALRLGR